MKAARQPTLEARRGAHGTLWFVRWRGALEPIAFTRKRDAQAFAELLQVEAQAPHGRAR